LDGQQNGSHLVYRYYTNEKVVDMPKNRAQFTPMRTTAADSITKLFITLGLSVLQDPLFDKQSVLVSSLEVR
jgi:hypothetical protein